MNGDEFMKLLENRRSCKRFSDRKVDKIIVDKILKAGTLAPSGRNLQSSIIIDVESKSLRDRLSKLNAAFINESNSSVALQEIAKKQLDPFYNAPQVFVVLTDKNVRTHVYDSAVVMSHMMLAAEAYGVSACLIHRAKEMFESDEGKAVLKELGIEGDYEGVGNLVIGYIEGGKRPAPEIKENYVIRA